jgi:hypothetical protein
VARQRFRIVARQPDPTFDRQCFIVRDAQRAGRSPLSTSRGRRAPAKLLTRDEARRIAANIAKLPSILAPLSINVKHKVDLHLPHSACDLNIMPSDNDVVQCWGAPSSPANPPAEICRNSGRR